MIDLFSPTNLGQDVVFFRMTLRRNDKCRPMASAAVYPKIFSAPWFHDVMMPSRVLLTMASSEESTIAASSALTSYALNSGRFMIHLEHYQAAFGLAVPDSFLSAQNLQREISTK